MLPTTLRGAASFCKMTSWRHKILKLLTDVHKQGSILKLRMSSFQPCICEDPWWFTNESQTHQFLIKALVDHTSDCADTTQEKVFPHMCGTFCGVVPYWTPSVLTCRKLDALFRKHSIVYLEFYEKRKRIISLMIVYNTNSITYMSALQ